ncbi:uncharacterized protein LOC143211044 [Lasioglossum baleicum]|uniref:uncharacterized protein LOC143211044 n=1 Tax=Lasioglossum baleicum TaxID=434251 RepID=UPI003FCCA03B
MTILLHLVQQLGQRFDMGLQQLEQKMNMGLQQLEQRVDMGLQQLQQNVDMGLQEIQQKVEMSTKQLEKKVEKITGMVRAEYLGQRPHWLPLDSQEDIQNFENCPDSDYHSVVGYLHQLGGHSLREAVRACFDDALSGTVALTHTWTGIRGTRPLYNTRIVRAIYEATLRNGDVIDYVLDQNDDDAVFEYLRAENDDGIEYLEPEFNDIIRLQQLEKKVDQQRNNWENRGTVVTLRTWSGIRGTRLLYYRRIMRAIHETTIRSTWYQRRRISRRRGRQRTSIVKRTFRDALAVTDARGCWTGRDYEDDHFYPGDKNGEGAVPSSTTNLTEFHLYLVYVRVTLKEHAVPEKRRRIRKICPDSTRNPNQKMLLK